MSKVSDKVLEIEELVYSGIPNEEIAKFLSVPLSWVEDVATELFETMSDGDGVANA